MSFIGYKRWILTPHNAKVKWYNMKTMVELVKDNKVNGMNIIR